MTATQPATDEELAYWETCPPSSEIALRLIARIRAEQAKNITAEPVGWRWRRNRWPDNDWIVVDYEPSEAIVNPDTDPVTIEPLYTHPAAVTDAMVEAAYNAYIKALMKKGVTRQMAHRAALEAALKVQS